MAYVTITNWTATGLTDDQIKEISDTFVPLIMGVGASGVQMVRTGDQNVCVITSYATEETAMAAQDKITEIRAKAKSEYPMTLDSAVAGNVFANA